MRKLAFAIGLLFSLAWIVSTIQTMEYQKNFGPYQKIMAKVVLFEAKCIRRDSVEVHLKISVDELVYESNNPRIGNFPFEGCLFGKPYFSPLYINDVVAGDDISIVLDKNLNVYFGVYSLAINFSGVFFGFAIIISSIFLFRRSKFR